MNTRSTRRNKRANNACQRCRGRKIRCSGGQPCTNCSRRHWVCRFDENGKKVTVSQRYLLQLQNAATVQQLCGDGPSTPGETRSMTGDELAGATNPLDNGTSSYVVDANGRLRCLGTSSTWSFSRKALFLTQNCIADPDLQPIDIHEESRAWHLTWDSHNAVGASSLNGLPTLDHATYLIHGIKFHIGQLFHLFAEEEFLGHVHSFYDNPAAKASDSRIWFVQYLVILALGKAIVTSHAGDSSEFPGQELFQRAMNLLPNPSSLFDDPITAIELLCSVAIYLQAADMRNASYIYVGQAAHMALAFGLHRECPTSDWSPFLVNRCRKVWWTVYILDQNFSVSLGVPPSIHGRQITAKLPRWGASTADSALYMNVRLANLASVIIDKVYGIEGRLHSTFLHKVREVLREIASIADDLNQHMPLSSEGSVTSISRVAAHLHLQCHQAVLHTMYPLLMYLYGTRLQDSQEQISIQPTYSETTNALLQTCADSCNDMIRILGILRKQELLRMGPWSFWEELLLTVVTETFLPFDLDRVFSASFALTMLKFICISFRGNAAAHCESDLTVQELINRGSVPAQYRRSELNQLNRLILVWRQKRQCEIHIESNIQSNEDRSSIHLPQNRYNTICGSLITSAEDMENSSHMGWLSPTQLLSLAHMVDLGIEDPYSSACTNSWLWEISENNRDDQSSTTAAI